MERSARLDCIRSAIKTRDTTIIDANQHTFSVSSKTNGKQREYTVNIKLGYCTCQYFVLKRIPCEHIYATIREVHQYSFSSLPPQLLNEYHMKIAGTASNSPTSTNTSNIDDMPITMPEPSVSPDLLPIPLAQTQTHQNKQHHSQLRDEVAKITQAIYR